MILADDKMSEVLEDEEVALEQTAALLQYCTAKCCKQAIRRIAWNSASRKGEGSLHTHRHILDSMVIPAAFFLYLRFLELVLDTIWALKRTKLRRFIVHLRNSRKRRVCQVACRRQSYRLKRIGCWTNHCWERLSTSHRWGDTKRIE